MVDQKINDLEYLRDCLLNGTTNIEGCLKHIEEQVRYMTESVRIYKRDLKIAGMGKEK